MSKRKQRCVIPQKRPQNPSISKKTMICSLCDPCEFFQFRSNLIHHLQTTHSKELEIENQCTTCTRKLIKNNQSKLTCEHCNRQFPNASELIQHVLTHNLETSNKLKTVSIALGTGITVSNQPPPPFYKCKTCLRIFTIHQVFKRHLRISAQAKKSPNPRKCQQCDFESPNICLMGVHIESHRTQTQKPRICKKCRKTFRTVNALIRHELEHEGKLSAICRNCGAYFRSVLDLEKHGDQCVNAVQKCKDCKRVFTSHWRLREHSHLHRPNVYFCDQCGREFKHLQNLNRHVNSRCGSEPWIFCDFCGAGFFARKSLAAHLRELHTTESMFICQYCGGEFLTRAQLTRHEARHGRKE